MPSYPIETVEQHIAAPAERIWALLTTTDAVTINTPKPSSTTQRADD
jgi:ligand-binding SRPBCC domain-containing protein